MKILILGGATGFGRSLVQSFKENNDEVIYTTYSIDKKETEYYLDLTAPKINGNLVKRLNHLDVVIFNAFQLGNIVNLANTDYKEIEEIFVTNVLSYKILLDDLIKNTECRNYINVSSGASEKNYSGLFQYCFTKNLTRQIFSYYDKELKNKRFISISPGPMKTNMQSEIQKNYEGFEDLLNFKENYEKFPTPDAMAKKFIAYYQLLLADCSKNFFDLREYT